jgi:hypothetical protein
VGDSGERETCYAKDALDLRSIDIEMAASKGHAAATLIGGTVVVVSSGLKHVNCDGDLHSNSNDVGPLNE